MSLRTAQRKASKGDLPVSIRTNLQGRWEVLVEEGEYPEALDTRQITEILMQLKGSMVRLEEKVDRLNSKVERVDSK